MTELAESPLRHDGWSRTALVLIVGYCLMGRSFAYLGIPPLHLFIGEVVLALFLLAGPKTMQGSWIHIVRRSRSLSRFGKLLSVFLAYGLFEVAHGIRAGFPALTALRDFAFNYYPIFSLLGVWVGVRNPHFMPRLFRILAWFNGIYGIIYILLLGTVNWTFPGVSDKVMAVPIWGLPEFSFVILLGLMTYERSIWAIWHLLILNAFVLLGMQIRGEWLAFAVGILFWAYFKKSLKKIAAATLIAILLFGAMFVADVRIPGPESRGGGTISIRDLTGRALAPLNSDLAAKYTSSYQMDVDTAVWRTVWWLAIWQAVHQSRAAALIGFGYGYPLGDLVPYLEGEFIQTPHNAFFYALGYTGWLGVLLFALLQAEIGRLLWRKYRGTGQWAGLVLLPAMFVYAQFTAFFEAPYGAIPFYLLAGALVGAPLASSYSARVARLQDRSDPLQPSGASAAPPLAIPEPEARTF